MSFYFYFVLFILRRIIFLHLTGSQLDLQVPLDRGRGLRILEKTPKTF